MCICCKPPTSLLPPNVKPPCFVSLASSSLPVHFMPPNMCPIHQWQSMISPLNYLPLRYLTTTLIQTAIANYGFRIQKFNKIGQRPVMLWLMWRLDSLQMIRSEHHTSLYLVSANLVSQTLRPCSAVCSNAAT